ncbi:hypothetical protein EGW08_019678 [Elysia chlorotica]|uniref:Uncharacterized protein n=1 Tax=Elysia chlorotica TaxID=188477 RepID=A0A433STG8_ELYCH|nr:hypothetical protein EGW08_019678 [Elysia chlorotica]
MMEQQLIIFVVILSGMVSHCLVEASPCQNPDKRPCFCSTSEGDVSLQALMDSQPNRDPLSVTSGGYTYYIAPCDNPITVTDCKNLNPDLVGCQVQTQTQSPGAFGMGLRYNYAVTGDPQKDTVVFINQFKDPLAGTIRVMRLHLACLSSEAGKLSFVNQTDPGPTTITYILCRYYCVSCWWNIVPQVCEKGRRQRIHPKL